MNELKKYFSSIDILLCFFLGIAFSIFPDYYNNGSYTIDKYLFFRLIIYFFTFSILCICIRVLIDKLNKIQNNKDGVIDKIFNKENKVYKYKIFIIAGMIFLLWLPIIIGLFPGTVANDTWGQLNQFLFLSKGGHLYDHHPVLDTIYMGIIISFIVNICNNWNLAFFVYVIIQALITSMVFAYSIIYAKEKLELNNVFIVCFLIIYAILPIFPTSVQAINKDAIFSWIYVLFFINYIEIIRTNGQQLKNKKFFALTIVLSILCCLTKKVGMYVLIGALISLLLIKICNKKKIVSIIMILLIIMMIIIPIIFNVFKIEKGGAQEKYSLLFQQTARYLKYNMEDVTENEKEIIEKVIGQDVNAIVQVYNPTLADPVKGYEQQTDRINYLKYLLVWATQGLRHPKTYLDATNCMLSGWISFNEYKPLMEMSHHTQLISSIIDENITKREGLAKSADTIQLIYDKLYSIPVIKYLLTPGLYTTLIPLFSLATILKQKENNKRYCVVLVPLFLSIILGCFLAPASDNIEGQRYLYPITYTFIIVLMWMIYIQKKGKENKNE